ncbi:MAG TPA: Gfo/Idh/MocA family oxidoreductase [Tepidisphaeraceae bacterium]|nr:Gfo/Idh/MocA family oxidoreductase [Tepidisphaeraceae bacterium]
MPKPIGVAMIGCGGIALANHIPGLALCPQARLVALCDSNPATLDRAKQASGVSTTFSDPEQAIAHPEVDAIIIATPNVVHAPIAHAAIRAGKHVMSEKPIAMNYPEAAEMVRAADAAGVCHLTAFTYRFVPAMRYMSHLVKKGFIGTPYHFRAQRFQDWGTRNLAWRQVKALAATGELGDMLSHRIDFAHFLMGPMSRLVARLRQYVFDRGGHHSDLDDWVSIIADFENGATGVFESTKLATGRGEGGKSPDVCEVNGSEGTLVYQVTKPNQIGIGRKGAETLVMEDVPEEFLKHPGSPRDVRQGDPVVTFRYDQNFEFIDAIANDRPASPSLADGARCQAVMDAAVKSDQTRAWVDVPKV